MLLEKGLNMLEKSNADSQTLSFRRVILLEDMHVVA